MPVTSASSFPGTAMSVNNQRVAEIVVQALTDHGNDTEAAWEELYQRRNDPNDITAAADVNLAAAEHYMLCRFWVGHGQYSAAQMRAMTFAYDQAKRWLPERLMRHDPDRPPTPPSQAALAWALAGIVAGEADRTAAGVAAPGWRTPPAFNERTSQIQEAMDAYGL